MRSSYFPKALPWLLKWIAAGRMSRVLKISDAMRALHKDAFECWKELLGPENFADLMRPPGQVHVWETDSESQSAALERKLRERQGIPARRWARRPAADVSRHLAAVRVACSCPAMASPSVRSASCRR